MSFNYYYNIFFYSFFSKSQGLSCLNLPKLIPRHCAKMNVNALMDFNRWFFFSCTKNTKAVGSSIYCFPHIKLIKSLNWTLIENTRVSSNRMPACNTDWSILRISVVSTASLKEGHFSNTGQTKGEMRQLKQS